MKTPEELSSFSAMVECQHPTADLYKFMGALKIFKDDQDANQAPRITAKVSLAIENTLLRGARLKDTEFVYGNTIWFLKLFTRL